jgi:hypothetical protein
LSDNSQSEHALEQGWKPIAWTRDYDKFRATIMMAADGTCMWRIFPFEQNAALKVQAKAETMKGVSENLKQANETITRIAAANPRIQAGPPTIIR